MADIQKRELITADYATRFLFLACDGVWEVHDAKKISVMEIIKTSLGNKPFGEPELTLVIYPSFNGRLLKYSLIKLDFGRNFQKMYSIQYCLGYWV